MKQLAMLPALAVGTVLVFLQFAQAESPCPPDGDDTVWPTFDTGEKCGSYSDCDVLMQKGRLEEAKTCNRKIDDCGVDLIKSNAKADAHNVALEACRSSIWSTVVKPADQ